MYLFIFYLSRVTLAEALAYIENSDEDWGDQNEADIAIMPPKNSTEDLTDEDSGGEDEMSVNNLPPSQLLAEAEIMMERESDQTNEGGASSEACSVEWDSEDDIPLAEYVKQRKIEKTKKYNWRKADLQSAINKTWSPVDTVANNNCPYELFSLFFDQEVLDLFVSYSNMYAARRNRKADISLQEMKCFFAILLLSGYSSVSRRRMYWEKSVDTHNQLVSDCLSRDRFEHILTNIHCCDNDNLDKSDRFSKLRPLIELMNKKFLEHSPHVEQHSVDEAMIPYFGRHPTKQFIRGKPIRYGYKFWVGATSFGYVTYMEPYQGAKSEIKNSSLGLGPSVILKYAEVLKSKQNASYHLYFDNFFTTVPLLEKLQEWGIKATGTIRENRRSKCPLPSNKDFKKNSRGTYKFRTIGDKSIVVAVWNDNSIVSIASNHDSVHPIHRVSRYSRTEKKSILVDQPHLIHTYNKYMGGVDRCDQNVGLYRTNVRGKKWYFPIVAHILDLAVQNAWLLHKKTQHGNLDHLTFRRRVVISLMAETKRSVTQVGRPSGFENVDSRFDRLDHFIASQNKQTRCRHCHKKVSTICVKCKVALHVSCFIPYHTRE